VHCPRPTEPGPADIQVTEFTVDMVAEILFTESIR
jgi:hypothetical protein